MNLSPPPVDHSSAKHHVRNQRLNLPHPLSTLGTILAFFFFKVGDKIRMKTISKLATSFLLKRNEYINYRERR